MNITLPANRMTLSDASLAPHQNAAYPFTALVGQDEMRLALTIAAIDHTVGGVLILGDRGTGKSTAVRALAEVLEPILSAAGCQFNCEPVPSGAKAQCPHSHLDHSEATLVPVPVVTLPLGVTEDRVIGALDLERALTKGERAFEAGLLARAHRGFLYIDEVNLLEDHIVDLLLDVASSGENIVERDGLSIRHRASFVLIGSGNPEEGELRPQLLDRFGLSVDVKTPGDVAARVEVIRRRDQFDRDRAQFVQSWQGAQSDLRHKISNARKQLDAVDVPDAILIAAARICIALGSDGLRGELTLIRAGRALAAFEQDTAMTLDHLKRVAVLVLGHRLRRSPLDETRSAVRIERAVAEVIG